MLRHKVVKAALVAVWIMGFHDTAARAQKILPEGIKDLATQIATNVAKEQKHRVAILPFRELDGKETILGTYISEDLVTNLFEVGGLEIVERAMLDRLIGELKLDRSGLIDPETAKKVGKIAGVDAIVTGSITDFQSYVALNCRLIDAETGRIFGAAQARIVKDDDLRKIMGMQLAPAPTEATEPQDSGRAAPTGGAERRQPTKAALQQQAGGVLFELKGCSRSGTSVDCTVFMTSKSEDQRILLKSSRLVDEEGNEYNEAPDAGEIRVRRSSGGTSLVSGIPMKERIEFEGISPEARTGALIELQFYIGRSREVDRVQFRNVPLTHN